MNKHSFTVEASEQNPGDLDERADAIFRSMLVELGNPGTSNLRRGNGTAIDERPGMISWRYEFSTVE